MQLQTLYGYVTKVRCNVKKYKVEIRLLNTQYTSVSEDKACTVLSCTHCIQYKFNSEQKVIRLWTTQ